MLYSRQIPDFRSFLRVAMLLGTAAGIAIVVTVGVTGLPLHRMQIRDHAAAVAEAEALLEARTQVAELDVADVPPFPG